MADVSYDFLSNDLSRPHHRKVIAVLVVTVLVFGGLIWVYLSRSTETSLTPINEQDQMRAEVLSTLRNASTPPPSVAEIDQMLSTLKKSEAAPPTDAERADVLERLRNSQ